MKNINIKDTVEAYLNKGDWRVKENSTVSYSIGGLVLNTHEAIVSRYWLTEVYDDDIRDAHKDAYIHIHDLGWLGAYCAGWSLKDLIKRGLVGVSSRTASAPAKHMSTLVNQMVNFIGIMANEWAGAQAFSSVDTYLSAFVKHNNMKYKEVKQCMQSLIFGLNFPNRWGSQAPFSNVTMDWNVPSDLAIEKAIVGGVELDFTYGDCQAEMNLVNKAFLEVMLEGDADGRGHQYPIPTYSITKDFDWSETENNKLLFEITSKYGTPYFSNYVNSDMDPSDVRSMCPLTSDTKVLVKSKQNGIRVAEIKDIVLGSISKNTEYQVWTPEGWANAKPVKVNKTDVYEITLSNGVKVKFGENHLQPTKDNGTLKAVDLKNGMWLPFNLKSYKDINTLGSFELGFAIGAYCGDGSRNKNSIIYSLDIKEKDDFTVKMLKSFWEDNMGFQTRVSYQKTKNVRFFKVNGNPYDIIKTYINGDNALNKKLTRKLFNSSVELREGFIAGMRATDGSRSKKRLYTSSTFLREDIQNLLAGLGRKALINYEDDRDGRLGKNTNYRIDYPERERYGELYDQDDNFNYYKIVNIEKINYSGEYLYCFEVDNDSNLFMLANGLITHNCRLQLDLRELRKKNGGFFGSGENTGSIGVVTLNLPRIAYESTNENEFFKELERYINISRRSLDIKRDIVIKFMENGLYPYSKEYLGGLDSHFSTIGIVGGNEMCLNANWISKNLTEKEAQDFSLKVLKFIKDKLSNFQEESGILYNLEATPAESTTFRFAKHDKKKHRNIITAGDELGETPYYTNSTHMPVGFSGDINEVLDIQDKLQIEYTSGTVLHGFIGEAISNWRTTMSIVKSISDNYKLPYYTISPTYSICPDHGYIIGEHPICDKCGKKTEIYSRITGYYRDVNNWNDGKRQEFYDRKEYKVE